MIDGRVTVSALTRGLALLNVLERAGRPLSLAELGRAGGLPKSTALRLLDTLREAGFVQRNHARYELGGAAFRLGLSYQRAHLLDFIRPILLELAAQDCDNPSFHRRYSPDARVCVLHACTSGGSLECRQGGEVFPLGKGAPGRVLAAFEAGVVPDQKVDVTISWGERVPNHVGVAVPVFGRKGRLLGALAVCGPQERFTPPALLRQSRRVIRAASALTAKLGGDPAMFQTPFHA